MWLLSFPPTVLIGMLFMASGSSRGGHVSNGVIAAFCTLVLVPLIETALLVLTISLFSRVFRSSHGVAVASAVVWAVLHSLAWPPWGIIIAWVFYVMSRAYVAWRPLGSARAFFVVVFIHAAHNLIPALAILA